MSVHEPRLALLRREANLAVARPRMSVQLAAKTTLCPSPHAPLSLRSCGESVPIESAEFAALRRFVAAHRSMQVP